MLSLRVVSNGFRGSLIVTNPETTTINDFLTSNGVDTTGCFINVDGKPVRRDQFISELNAHDGSYVSTCVKADSASKINVSGPSVTIVSSVKLDDIKELKKYMPDALTMYEGDGADKQQVFVVDYTENGAGDASKWGIVFSNVPTEEGFATAMFVRTNANENPENEIVDKFGSCLMKLSKWETSVAEKLADIEHFKDSVTGMITMF